MLKLKIKNAGAWKQGVDAIAALIDEGTFEFSEKGARLKAMDPSQIAMVDFSMPKSAFKEYNVEGKQNVGIDVSELSRVTKRAKNEDTVTIELKGNKLDISFSGKTNRRFVLPLIDSNTHPNEPKIEFDSDLKLSSNEFKEALGDVELVSNYVTFDVNKDKFMITAESESGKAEVALNKEAVMDMSIKSSSRSMFPLEYLKNMVKNADAATIINMKLKSDAPLRMEYAIGDSSIVYFLAPRIESV